MSRVDTEQLLYGGELPEDRMVFQMYLADVQRGKSLLQLQAVAAAVTPEIRRAWSPRTFTKIQTSSGCFDEVVCNISYHFHKHGQEYGDIASMTRAAQQFFNNRKTDGRIRARDGLLVFPTGSVYELDDRIVTFVSDK